MQYRKEIDGLRAFAVVPVLLFHAGFDLFSGGYVGVDVFFVISGYLITSIIIREKAEGTFTFANFYERRARRILPALFLVMLACIPFAWFWMAPHQLKDFSQSLLSTTAFLSNVFFYLETDYFNDFAETAPLLHTWSLAVEEQYYLFFPPLILLLWRLGVTWTLSILGIIAVASLVGAEFLSTSNSAVNFYLLPTRVWELFVGVFAALYLFYRDKDSGALARLPCELLAGLGLLAIFYSVFTFDSRTPFPSLWALIPTLGTALIVVFGHSSTWTGRLLGLRPLVGVGLISYSLYLWHQPLLALARIRNFGPLDGIESGLIIVLSFVLAYASFTWCEAQFRDRSLIKTRYFLAAAAFLAIAFMSLGYYGHDKDGFISYKVSQLGEDHRKIVIDQNLELARRKAAWTPLLAEGERPFDDSAEGQRVLLLGDSKSEDLYVSLIMNKELFGGFQFRRLRLDDSCMTVEAYDHTLDPTEECLEEVQKLEASNLLNEADVVIVSNTWTVLTIPNAKNYIDQLSAKKRHIFIVNTGHFNDVSSLSMQIAENELSGAALERFLFDNIRQDWRRLSVQLAEGFRETDNVTYLDKLQLFCDFDAKGCTLFSETGEPYYFDTGHVTVEGAQYYGRRVFEEKWLDRLR